MKFAGKTPDGLPVLSGIGTLCFTNGVPLEIVLMYFKDNELVVDWVDYIHTALVDGHNPRTIRARIESSTADVYGKDYAAEVMVRIDKVLAVLVDK